MKITGGALGVKEELSARPDAPRPWQAKADQLRLYNGTKFQLVDTALPGMVVAVAGLPDSYPGEGLGAEPDAAPPALEPVLRYRVLLPQGCDVPTALRCLRELEQEDPLLHVVWDERLGQLHLQLMGEVQLEVLQSLLERRFGLRVEFGEGGILYKETITGRVEGVGHYEPLRHYAEVHLLLEPAPAGSGIHLATACREDDLAGNWQRLILTHLGEKDPHRAPYGRAPHRCDPHPGIGPGPLKAHRGRGLPPGHLPGGAPGAAHGPVPGAVRAAGALVPVHPAGAPGRLGPGPGGHAPAVRGIRPPGHPGGGGGAHRAGPGGLPAGLRRGGGGLHRGRGQLSCLPAGYFPCHNTAQVVAAAGYDIEGDLENTADSVFCSHGAGFTVRWDKVPAHMHLPSVLARGERLARAAQEQEEEEAPRTVEARAAAYRDALAQDKELMAIFERTYGPIKHDPLQAFRPVKKSPAKKAQTAYRAKPPKEGPEHLLVDGYNVIFAWDDLRDLAAGSLEAARGKLMDILCNYAAYRQCVPILVFDAYKVKGGVGSVERYHNLYVVYTKEAETADMYIEKATHRIAKHHRTRVVTSDATEQLIILGAGALRGVLPLLPGGGPGRGAGGAPHPRGDVTQ